MAIFELHDSFICTTSQIHNCTGLPPFRNNICGEFTGHLATSTLYKKIYYFDYYYYQFSRNRTIIIPVLKFCKYHFIVTTFLVNLAKMIML